jgi:hypothetical protein
MNYTRTAILLAGLTALFMAVGYLLGGPEGMVIAFIVAVAMNLFSYWRSDRLVLSMYGAQEVDDRTAPEFVGLVRELSSRAGLPMPRAFLMDNPQPNAFATGRNPEHAAVAATTGLLDTLSPRELAGVIGHELTHIRNRDTLTMTVTATIAGAISMLAQFGGYSVAAAIARATVAAVSPHCWPFSWHLWPQCWSRWRSAGPVNMLPIVAVLSCRMIHSGSSRRSANSRMQPARSRTRRPNRTRRRRRSLSSTRSRGSAWTICSRPTRRRKTASPPSRSLPAHERLDRGRRVALLNKRFSGSMGQRVGTKLELYN